MQLAVGIEGDGAFWVLGDGAALCFATLKEFSRLAVRLRVLESLSEVSRLSFDRPTSLDLLSADRPPSAKSRGGVTGESGWLQWWVDGRVRRSPDRYP